MSVSKSVLRKCVLSELLKVKGESVLSQSKIIAEKLQDIPQFKNAGSVGIYMNMPTMEVNTQDIIEQCFEQGKKVYLPRCDDHFEKGRRQKHLTFLSVPSLETVLSLKPSGKYKLREPSTGEDVMKIGSLDLLIVPGVAFTLSGKRLGHGAGYYDEFLKSFHSRFGKVPHLVGLSLVEQIVDLIPTEDHDWNLDQILYPGSIIE